MRKRDAGLGVTDDGTAYTLKSSAPHAVGPVEGPQAFLPRHFTRGKDGAPSDTVPPLTEDSDRGDGMAAIYGFTSTLGSLSADGVEEDATPPVMSRTPPAVSTPEGYGLGRDTSVSGTLGARGKEGGNTADLDRAGAYVGTLRSHPRPGSNSSTEVVAEVDPDGALYALLEELGELPPVPFDPQPDGPRYSAMGDAVTVNVAEWIGVGLHEALEA